VLSDIRSARSPVQTGTLRELRVSAAHPVDYTMAPRRGKDTAP